MISRRAHKNEGLLTDMGNEIRYFGYPHLLDERVHSLAFMIKKKDVSLTYAHMTLSIIDVDFVEANKALDSFRKTLKET